MKRALGSSAIVFSRGWMLLLVASLCRAEDPVRLEQKIVRLRTELDRTSSMKDLGARGDLSARDSVIDDAEARVSARKDYDEAVEAFYVESRAEYLELSKMFAHPAESLSAELTARVAEIKETLKAGIRQAAGDKGESGSGQLLTSLSQDILAELVIMIEKADNHLGALVAHQKKLLPLVNDLTTQVDEALRTYTKHASDEQRILAGFIEYESTRSGFDGEWHKFGGCDKTCDPAPVQVSIRDVPGAEAGPLEGELQLGAAKIRFSAKTENSGTHGEWWDEAGHKGELQLETRKSSLLKLTFKGPAPGPLPEAVTVRFYR
jgi:hypothetical protein